MKGSATSLRHLGIRESGCHVRWPKLAFPGRFARGWKEFGGSRGGVPVAMHGRPEPAREQSGRLSIKEVARRGRMWSCLTTILRLVAHGVGVRGVEVGELPSHGGRGEGNHQSNCDEKLLHESVLSVIGLLISRSNRLAMVPIERVTGRCSTPHLNNTFSLWNACMRSRE